MAYVITEPCIGQKDASCVDVCPVDCIHPAPGEPGFASSDQLYVDPLECIDCDACAEACPVDAVMAASVVPAHLERFVALNAEYFNRDEE